MLSFLVSSSYRGIAHDEGISNSDTGARRILTHQSVFNPHSSGSMKGPGRLIYIVCIAVGYKLLGFNLLALHIFPYLIQIMNPLLFFVVVYLFYKNIWWGFGGALLFIFHPFNLVYLNQQHNHPIFMFFLLIMLTLVKCSVKNPRLFIGLGILSSLLLLTRFAEGVIFVTLIYAVYILEQWKTGIPLKWLGISLVSLLATYSVFAFVFDFPLLYPFYYIPHLFERQELHSEGLPFSELTKLAFRALVNWYFCGKVVLPFLLLLTGIGAIVQIKNRCFYPIALFLPHFLFISLVFSARGDVGHLEPMTLSVPGFILLLLGGTQFLQNRLFSHVGSDQVFSFFQKSFATIVVLGILASFGRSAYSLAVIAEDSHTASNMWRIVKYNPAMPGNPLYQETSVQLSQEHHFSVPLREYLFKTVLGNYRSWFLHEIGKYAFDHNLPEQARARADFSYVDDYQTNDKWKADIDYLEGTSPLWTDEHPGRVGAFPFGKEGTFMYKFDFPKTIVQVTISDIHTQWGIGDIVKMWTSTDGEHWALRHHNWNVHSTQDWYYQVFEDEFDGYQTVFIKYYFKAGDKSRAGNDNRGASLEQFSLAVTYHD